MWSGLTLRREPLATRYCIPGGTGESERREGGREGGRVRVRGGRERVRGGRVRVRGGRVRVREGRESVRGGWERVRGGRERVRGGRERVRGGRERVRGGREGGREGGRTINFFEDQYWRGRIADGGKHTSNRYAFAEKESLVLQETRKC